VRLLVTAVLGLLACGGGNQPPHGPHYDPVNSPEAQSPCPTEWKAAKQARDAALAGGAEARPAAAAAVLAQADCEAARVVARRMEVTRGDLLVAEMREVRKAYDSARNLYNEVVGYGDPRLVVAGWSGAAALALGFAAVLEHVPPPVDSGGAVERAEIIGEMRELEQSFQGDAALAAARALEQAARLPPSGDAALAGWVARACKVLAATDPQSVAGYPACPAQ
jgi:hypothetical protein